MPSVTYYLAGKIYKLCTDNSFFESKTLTTHAPAKLYECESLLEQPAECSVNSVFFENASNFRLIFTAATKLREGNVFTPGACIAGEHERCRVCVWQGGMCVSIGGSRGGAPGARPPICLAS